MIGLLLGRRRPAWIADFRDGWTFEPLGDPFPTGPQRRLDAWLERRVVGVADIVTCAYAGIADDLRTRLGAQAHHVPNAWDPDAAPTSPEPAPASHANVVTLVHTGTISGTRGRDPRPLLEALRRVSAEERRRPLRLLIAGHLTTEERRLLDQHALGATVEHLGLIDRGQAIALQRSADALVLVTDRRGSAATAKLFEYLAAGRPIIALAENNEAAAIVRDTNTGMLVPPGDVDAIADALRLAASGELAKRYEPRNLERYTYPGPALLMEELVEEAIAHRDHPGGRGARRASRGTCP
jgi:glycosyltransferase involved in cell wall biosynthesis